MSEYGHINDDTATVLRLFAARLDQRVSLGTKITAPRKATRNRPSSVRVIRDASIMHPVQVSAAEMNERLVWDRAVPGTTLVQARHKQRSFAGGGATRLSDYHKRSK